MTVLIEAGNSLATDWRFHILSLTCQGPPADRLGYFNYGPSSRVSSFPSALLAAVILHAIKSQPLGCEGIILCYSTCRLQLEAYRWEVPTLGTAASRSMEDWEPYPPYDYSTKASNSLGLT